MEILLEELYKIEFSHERFHDRKICLGTNSYHIRGISNSGKTALVRNYLLTLKKNSYLYVDCNDVRIQIDLFNKILPAFCSKNGVKTLVFDNYTPQYMFPNVTQIITISQENYVLEGFESLLLYPLDYEEFLAFEHKYDSSALNHFFQLGTLPSMHTLHAHERTIYIQKMLRYSLHEIEFDLLQLCAKFISQKLSPYTLYERLKLQRKISKDKLYLYFQKMVEKNYIHLLEKFQHPRATKKIYLCDTTLKTALSIEKNFSTLFENMVYLELRKANTECFYTDGVDFYIPSEHEIILCKPFADERRLFKKLEALEAFLLTHAIEKVSVITMNKEGTLSHPLLKVDIIPFDIWALGD